MEYYCEWKYCCCHHPILPGCQQKSVKGRSPKSSSFSPWFNFFWDSINFQFFKTSQGGERPNMGISKDIKLNWWMENVFFLWKLLLLAGFRMWQKSTQNYFVENLSMRKVKTGQHVSFHVIFPSSNTSTKWNTNCSE